MELQRLELDPPAKAADADQDKGDVQTEPSHPRSLIEPADRMGTHADLDF
jgi:hypothetical protein